MAANATSSVEETIAPRTSATPQDMPGMIVCATHATISIVATTKPNAIWKIQKAAVRNSLVGAVTLSQYSSGGRKITKTRSGGSGTVGRCGIKPIAIPPKTSTIG